MKDRIALAEMKDRQKNAQAVDRATNNHRRMHKEIAEARQVISSLLPHLKILGGSDDSAKKALSLITDCEALLLKCDAAATKVRVLRVPVLVCVYACVCVNV